MGGSASSNKVSQSMADTWYKSTYGNKSLPTGTSTAGLYAQSGAKTTPSNSNYSSPYGPYVTENLAKINSNPNDYIGFLAKGMNNYTNDISGAKSFSNKMQNLSGMASGMGYKTSSDIATTLGNIANYQATGMMPEEYVEQPIEQYDPTQYINEMKQAQLASRMSALDKSRTGALSALDTEKANIAPTYYDKRNQAAAASDVGAMNFAQYMAARGIKGAAGAMPEVYRQAGLQGQIGALDRQEAGALSAIERQRANVESGYQSDVAAANADVEAQAMQAAINQYNADRTYAAQQAAAELERQKFDWARSSSNPEYQASIAAARSAELKNAAQEIENSYLPDTLKMQAKLLEQKVNVGSLDYDTALAQLNQIKAQTAKYQRDANEPYKSGSGGSGGLTAGQEETSRKAMNDWVTKQVLADDRLLSDQSNFAQLYDAWKNMYVKMNYGG